MSFVLVQASTISALKVSRTPCSSAACKARGVDGRVGDDDREHRRHGRRQHRRALGHAADREALPVGQLGDDEDLLADRVGGEDRLGRGASRDLVGRERRRRAWGRRPRCSSSGSGMPMRPVEHTSTSLGCAAELLARPARTCDGRRRDPSRRSPRSALPELSTTAAALAAPQVLPAHLHRRRSGEVAGEDAGGRRPARGRRSRRARGRARRCVLMPHATPAASNPGTPVMLIVSIRSRHQPDAGSGRWSRAGRARGSAPGSPGPTRPSRGCRARRARAPTRCARRTAR